MIHFPTLFGAAGTAAQSSEERLIQAIEKLNGAVEALQSAGAVENPAARIIISIVPVLGVVLGVAVIFFYLLWRYKVTKELIRTGKYERTSSKNFRAFCLLLGTVSTAVGFPLTILFALLYGVSSVLLGGLMPLFAGIGLILFVYLSKDKMME